MIDVHKLGSGFQIIEILSNREGLTDIDIEWSPHVNIVVTLPIKSFSVTWVDVEGKGNKLLLCKDYVEAIQYYVNDEQDISFYYLDLTKISYGIKK